MGTDKFREIMNSPDEKDAKLKRRAFEFIILLGVVSLFADITYEGARGITGPFLAKLGASSVVVGIVGGLGELIGYGVRFFTGYIADRTGKYWGITIFGYIVNLIAVPCLAFAGNWPLAAGLIILERFGKGIRTPARDAILSSATHQVGHGFGFGLHEFMDQLGAISGPLIAAGVLAWTGKYTAAFAILFIPALAGIAVLAAGRAVYPQPREFEPVSVRIEGVKAFPRAFWVYLVGVGLVAAGFADFALVAYHFKRAEIFRDDLIPVLYAFAMGVDAIAALVFGRLFDRIGIRSMAIAAVIAAFFAPLVFWGGPWAAVAGMALWGIGMGAQESIMRASVAQLIGRDRRGSAYGIFNSSFGVCWFIGSAIIGILYGISIPALIAFSVILQLAGAAFFIFTRPERAE